MADFATAADLDAHLDDDTVPQTQAEQAIAGATGRIRDWTEQNIWPPEEAVLVKRVPFPGRRRVQLPHPPAIPVTVTQVEVDGEALDPDGWELDRLNDLHRADGLLWTGRVEVTYTHGFAQVPATVKNVCLELAAREVGNPEGVMQAKLRDQSVAWAAEPGAALGLDRSHVRDLARFKLLAAA